MTFAAVGSLLQAQGAGTSLTMNNQGAGNLLLVEVVTNNNNVWATSISGGGATWVQMGVVFNGTTNNRSGSVFAGKVTSTGAGTATITYNGSSLSPRVSGHEFSSTVGAWALDVQGHLDSSGTNTWASLTPAGAGELYFGYSTDAGTATAGSTTGFTYADDAVSNGVAWNPACGGAAQAPVWGDSGMEFGIMILVKEVSSGFRSQGPARASIPPKPRLAGPYMGVGQKDVSFGTGQVQWGTGGPISNPTPGPKFFAQIYPIRSKVPRHTRTFGGWTAGTVPKIIQLTNTAEGGTSGTTASASNTGGASGNAFDTVSIVANGTLAFDNSEAAHGLLSYKAATGATSGTALLEWSQSLQGPQLTVWYRAYLYYTAQPASASSPVEVRAGASAAALITINSSGNLELFDGTGSGHNTFTNAIPLNSWFRIEGYVTGNASKGAISCSLFTPKDSTTALESHTATGVNTTGLITQMWYGENNSGASQGPWWMDDIGVSNAGYLGPSGGNIPLGDYGFLDSISLPSIITTFPSM